MMPGSEREWCVLQWSGPLQGQSCGTAPQTRKDKQRYWEAGIQSGADKPRHDRQNLLIKMWHLLHHVALGCLPAFPAPDQGSELSPIRRTELWGINKAKKKKRGGGGGGGGGGGKKKGRKKATSCPQPTKADKQTMGGSGIVFISSPWGLSPPWDPVCWIACGPGPRSTWRE